jgi:hypothetical protein
MIKKIISLLLISNIVLAGSPVLWGPNFTALSLEQNLNLNNIASLLTGTSNPTVVAQSAPQGSLYLRTGASGGTLYVKQDAGSTTNWSALAAGGISIAPFSTTPSANGLTLSGSVLNMDPADATHPGGVTITAQTFAGIKTFNSGTDMNSSKITHVADPTLSTDAATKNYVDTQLNQLNPAAAVVAASTATIAGTYVNAVSGVCIGDTFTTTALATLSIDGVAISVGNRVLLKNQTSSFQDGVWTLTTQGVGGISGAILTRALDFDSSADINAGSIVPIINGTVNAGASYYQSATVVTCSADAQTWTQFQAASSAYLLKANNLSDVAVAQTAINNISQLTTKGDIEIYSGTNTTRQAACPDGQNLQYLASSANGVTCVTPSSSGSGLNARWTLTGATVPFIDIDGPHYQTSTKSLSFVNLAMLNSGTSGVTSVRLNQYRAGLLLNAQTATVAASSGLPVAVTSTLTGVLSLLAGDAITVDVTMTATGAPESISVEY